MGREQTENNKISEIYSAPENKFYREKNKSEKEDGECCVHACVCAVVLNTVVGKVSLKSDISSKV